MSQGTEDLETQYNTSFSELKVRLQELEALVKGLTDEVLDLRAVILNIQKENKTAPVIREIPIKRENSPSPVRPVITVTPTVEDIPNENVQASPSHVSPPPSTGLESAEKKKEHIVLKMQPDGTVQPMKEKGEDIIIASTLDPQNKENTKKKSVHDIIVADE